MSNPGNARSFWAAKARSDSPSGLPRPREGRTMEGLRSTLEKTRNWDGQDAARPLPAKPLNLPAKIVQNNVFVERDRTPSPASSPTFGRKSPFAKDVLSVKSSTVTSPILPRPTSPFKSSMASPEPLERGLTRSKSVTFNESLEVRHMSECSYEETSSPMSATHSLEEQGSELEDFSDNEDFDADGWSVSTSHRRYIPDMDSPSSASSRALPRIPGARPLPVVPVHEIITPEVRLRATEEEDSKGHITGLALHLSDASNVVQDEAPPQTEELERLTAELEDAHLQEQQSDNPDLRQQAQRATERARLRSPEPAISRLHVKEKLAQRKAAKEMARKEQEDALQPHDSLAPPLPHFDSFIGMNETSTTAGQGPPESPLSDVSDVSKPMRKVSDTHRPSTPIEQITEQPSLPQSGRALHHERDKRLSIDLTKEAPPASPRSGFTAICYEGDDYGNSDEETLEDDLIIHKIEVSRDTDNEEQDSTDQTAEVKSAPVQIAAADSVASPLQHLPDIPEAPKRTANISPPSTPVLSSFDLRPMSLFLDFETVGNDSLGLEQYMTPEGHPETPITSRTVAPISPTKISSTPSLLSSWVDATDGPNKENSTVPEPATITARGMKLRTRPSITPADAVALAARRRQVSLELMAQENGQHVENSPENGERKYSIEEGDDARSDSAAVEEEAEEDPVKHIVPMAMPVLKPLTRELSFSDINSAFDRVMQKQKKGYVIRQQSPVVYATANLEDSRPAELKEEDSSKGHTRQSSSVYTTFSQISGKSSEQGGSHRRQGSKIPVGVQMSPKPRASTSEVVRTPVLEKLDGGRLFIRVMYVKNLNLPIPKGEEAFFTCTLDNGKHCVTTPRHTLAVNTKINQEFELIADHDLEFILTLQAQYVPPVVPTRPKSTLGRLLNSPKKHKPTGSITSLSLAGFVGDNGSFARAHLALKHFRNKAFGRPHTMLVPILNEWAIETTGMSSKTGPQTRQRKPYKIGEIELQVLYVPPVDMDHRYALPTSLSQAVRDIRDAEWHSVLHIEGFLSQQGGDCPFWRRRHFKLVGSKLTAYHANTGQVRATINLAKATHVTDDRDALLAPEVTIGKGETKTRRKSGFAEREEGHLYVAEGFRIRFANGELIDFYADSHAEKERWMNALRGIVQKIPVAKAWCQTVLEFETARNDVRKS